MKGGARNGAGRKRLPPELKKRAITIRLRPAIVEWMKAQDGSYSKQVEKSLAFYQQGKL